MSREFVHYALTIGALELLPKKRRLKSGRESPYFFDSAKFKNGATLSRLARGYAEAAMMTGCDVLYGPAYKGIPLVSTVSMVMADRHGRTVGYAFNRKEAKDHGEGGLIVGDSLKGKRVTILDDVMTSGGSVAEACDLIRAEGGSVVGCVIGFNRQERGEGGKLSAVEEFEHKENIRVQAAGTFKELIAELEAYGDTFPNGKEVLSMILAYREQYGIQT